jgi:hypothetical protein
MTKAIKVLNEPNKVVMMPTIFDLEPLRHFLVCDDC